jgi:hypothetical protein
VLPEAPIFNRVALTHFLAEQLHNLGQRKAKELEECWETQRDLLAAVVSASIPSNKKVKIRVSRKLALLSPQNSNPRPAPKI